MELVCASLSRGRDGSLTRVVLREREAKKSASPCGKPRLMTRLILQRVYSQMPCRGLAMARCIVKPDAVSAVIAVAVAGTLVGSISSATAQYRGTPEMQQACTPDVMRLCNADVPDVDKIVACMKRNRANLSPACGAVFGAGLRHDPRRR
jgi:hypothetical protein